ncbi:lysM and putative peptidoglycan-binding domain-containing protein 3-like [Macrobrachium rosenbergii]|uniref:lysM and putative peptidoglycan-binding domain-containing protein 3-like n=1 Tax=Macrobrachium rosenbergii TaxID=79674 RepID=UPI0034D6312F
MTSPFKNGRAGNASSHRNYKYRRLSSVEKGSDNIYVSCDEDEDEIFTSQVTELKKVGGRSKRLSTDTPVRFVSEYEQLVNRPIKSGETLRSISLKYRVPLSELKRINNIMQENEFFALNTLKIPVKANSVLAEMLEEEQKDQGACGEGPRSISSARAALLGTRSISSCSEYESDSEMHVGYISIDRILRDTRTKKEAKRFLDTMQKDLAEIRAKTNTYKDSLDEAAAALNDLRFRPLDPSGSDYSGADWGLNWWKILLIGLIILIGVPLGFIFFYFKNNSSS